MAFGATGVAPVQDEPVVHVQLELGGHRFAAALPPDPRSLPTAQAGAIRHPEDMGIDRYGGQPKAVLSTTLAVLRPPGRASSASRFPAPPPPCLSSKDGAGLDDVLGLGVEQANGLDVLLHAVHPQSQHGGG